MSNRKLATMCATILALGLSMPIAHAEWKGKGELGVVLARGNTDTDTVNAKFDMETEVDRWKHSFGFSALRSTTSDVETGNRWEGHGQSDYKLSQRSYALATLRYEHDEFSPYVYQAVATLGYGYRFIDTDRTKLATELGAGYRRTEDRLTSEVRGEPIARGGLNFEHKMTESSLIFDKLLVEYGSDNTFTQNEAGVKVNINASLALSVAHLLRHNSTVAAPSKKTDQQFTVNLVFAF